MTNRFQNAEAEKDHHYLAWLGIPLASFPLVALLSYDWHAIAYLQTPPAASANWIGRLGDLFAFYGYQFLGLAIWIIPVLCILGACCILLGRSIPALRRLSWFTLFTVSFSCLLQILGNHPGFVSLLSHRVNISCAGGFVGYIVMTRCLLPLISDFGASILMASLMVISFIAAIGLHNLAHMFRALFSWALARDASASAAAAPGFAPVAPATTDSQPYEAPFSPASAEPSAPEPPPSSPLALLKAARDAARRQREEEKAAARQEKAEAKAAAKAAKKAAKLAASEGSEPPIEDKGPYLLPPLSLLDPLHKAVADHGDVNEMSTRLIDTLKLFGIDASLSYTVQGPVVTKYAILLAPGTLYSRVTSLSDNLMGALRAKSLRIEAPIPGEECVGIEVPNRTSVGISFREIIESPAWKSFHGELPLLFGKDAAGHELVADLAKMPHMLVAGATGQGKSVCLNSIINGLLMTRTPEQLKLIMVDPKSVEFTAYASLPHLLVPVITDNRKVVFSLHWAVAEMEKRLKMFASAKVRNIYDFNHRATFAQPDMFGGAETATTSLPKTIPYIVIIIDEVADLMSSNGKEVTPDIARLTAKARAAGIHLILATQRPDAKIITGTIKANIPGRVAFKTATSIDSRTILDDTGAENLIGKGDMLYKTADGRLIRAQGAWLSDPEIERITQFIAEHANTEFDETFNAKLSRVKEVGITDPFADNEDDPDNQESSSDEAKEAKAAEREQVKADESASDFKKAVECIINTNRASISHFQRRMGWGYNHAAKIIDMLEDRGILGPQAGAGPRPIIMDQQQLMAIFQEGSPNATPEPELALEMPVEESAEDPLNTNEEEP